MEQAAKLVAHRYEVGEVVGRGGYGTVCRGIDRVTCSTVAIKLLSAEASKDPDVVERMLREQQALLALEGTSAVATVELCRLDGGAPCLVMEWLEGRDLELVMSEREAQGQLGELTELVTILSPITSTLERAHDLGLFHRDIKPANLFHTPSGRLPARLLDFGLSRMKSAAPITASGMVMGSPSYIAPETWAGDSRALDGRADLFSLAVIVFRWLTGKLPFDAPDLIAKMTAVTSGPRPSVLALRPDLPPRIDEWMNRALAVDREMRFQTGGEFHRSLRAALLGDDYPIAKDDASGIRKVGSEPARRNPLLSAWDTATSLLKRITGTADPEVSHGEGRASPAAVVVEEAAPLTDRHSVWLDSDDLEDVLSERAPSVQVVQAPSPQPTLAAPLEHQPKKGLRKKARRPRHERRKLKAKAKAKSRKHPKKAS